MSLGTFETLYPVLGKVSKMDTLFNISCPKIMTTTRDSNTLMHRRVNYETYLLVVLGVIALPWEFTRVYASENNIFK